MQKLNLSGWFVHRPLSVISLVKNIYKRKSKLRILNCEPLEVLLETFYKEQTHRLHTRSRKRIPFHYITVCGEISFLYDEEKKAQTLLAFTF